MTNVANELGEPKSTVENYIDVLAAMYPIENVPAWSSNMTKRAVKHNKCYYLDSGMLSRMLNAKPETATDIVRDEAGAIFETFVLQELRKLISWSDEQYQIMHYRDTDRQEVDFIIENITGEFIGIEVKASSSVSQADLRSLKFLLRRHPDSMKLGIVVYTGKNVLVLGDRLFAVPAEVLWRY
jgi:predicted AAA+ superfamily ATPase